MKKLFFAIAIAAISISVNAQDTSAVSYNTSAGKNDTYTSKKNAFDKKFIMSIGIEPSIPVGHFHDYSGFGFGGSLQGEVKPSQRVGITINAGYIAYSGKTVKGVDYPTFKYWPAMGGLKIYMGNTSKTYIHGQAGPGFGTDGLGTSFWYGGGVGVNLGKTIDAELRYAGWKQNQVNVTGGNGGVYGGTGGTGGTGGGYGGHYSTIGLRLAVNF
jgi:hypothetical protein